MGKLDKEQEARMAGMRYALGIAKEKGVDGLQKELQMRGALGIGLLIDNDKLKKGIRDFSRDYISEYYDSCTCNIST